MRPSPFSRRCSRNVLTPFPPFSQDRLPRRVPLDRFRLLNSLRPLLFEPLRLCLLLFLLRRRLRFLHPETCHCRA